MLVGAESGIGVSDVSAVLRLPSGRRALARSEARAAMAMRSLGLLDLAFTEVEALPHGTRRLVEIARVLAMSPTFVLVDEPGAGLSEAELVVLSDCLTSMTALGIGVLLIEHTVPLVLSMAAQVTALHQGRPRWRGVNGPKPSPS